MRNFDNVENVLYDALRDMWFAVVEEPTHNVCISREDAKAWFTLKISNHEDGILCARSALALFDMREK